MKRVLCLLLALCLCLALPACGAPAGTGADDTPPPAPSSTFPPEYLYSGSSPEITEENLSECPDLAVVGAHIWRCTHGQIRCDDPASGANVSALPMTDLLADGETALYRSVTPWGEDSVLLCLSVAAEAGPGRVELVELGLDDGAVAVRERREAGETLKPLFGEDADWLEIDMISNGQRLFFSALDPSFRMHFHLYTPETGSLLPLGELDLSMYHAVLPRGDDDMLLLASDDTDETVLKLMRLSLTDGATEELSRTEVDSVQDIFNYAYDSTANRLYFTINSAACAVTPGSGERPEIIGSLGAVTAMFRLGALAGGRYICHGVEGELLSCDAHGEFSVIPLRIADCVGDATVADAARGFGAACPQYALSIYSGGDGNDLLTKLRTSPEEYDACVLTLDSTACLALFEDGFAADLGGSRLLSAVADDMPLRMRAALERDGRLLAFPIAVINAARLLNVPALEELAGISRDQIPTDWVGFLEMMRNLAQKGVLMEQGPYVLYGGGVTIEQFREIVLGNILQDCLILKSAGELDNLQKVLLPVLKAYEKVDWTGLGLPMDDWSGDGDFPPELETISNAVAVNASGAGKKSDESDDFPLKDIELGTPVMSDYMLEIEVMDMAEGETFWPLSLRRGGKRLIPQSITVVCVNPHSPHREAALSFLEYLWGSMGLTTKMTICQSVNDPVSNPNYKDDLAYYEGAAAQLEQMTAEEKDPVKKVILNTQAEDARAFADRFRKNASWAASEESIAYYRSVQNDMIPTGDAFWSDPTVANAMFDYLDGVIGAKQFIKTLEPLI